MTYTLRFDLRCPPGGTAAPDLYEAALDMCEWADSHGGFLTVLSEHHATSDGHLPSPLVLGAAVAARTKQMRIMLAAVVLPLYDPVRLAEDLALLDIVSRGRVAVAFGVGHRREEYEYLGVDFPARGRTADDNLRVVVELLTTGRTTVGGREITLQPTPASPDGPMMLVAGGSRAAVTRAARHGLGFLAQANPPGLAELYRSECERSGRAPGFAQFPDGASPTAVFVADDVDRAWAEIGPYLLHDAVTAASYRAPGSAVASITPARTVDELRRPGGPYAVVTPDEAARMGVLGLHPLCGGMPPEVAWPYLRRAAEVVSA